MQWQQTCVYQCVNTKGLIDMKGRVELLFGILIFNMAACLFVRYSGRHIAHVPSKNAVNWFDYLVT
jgi:hypothetical protein